MLEPESPGLVIARNHVVVVFRRIHDGGPPDVVEAVVNELARKAGVFEVWITPGIGTSDVRVQKAPGRWATMVGRSRPAVEHDTVD